jgi:hypothetical protein
MATEEKSCKVFLVVSFVFAKKSFFFSAKLFSPFMGNGLKIWMPSQQDKMEWSC